MPYLTSFGIKTEKTHPFPFNASAVKYAKHIDVSAAVTFIVGDNGTGKSTLLEALAYRLQLPHMNGSGYQKSCFEGARQLLPFINLNWDIERSIGFFFRAEDFGDLINSADRQDFKIQSDMNDLVGEVPDHIIREMKQSANFQLHHMRKNYGQDLQSFSHGEAYLKIMQEKIEKRGIFILDEPEAALSPSKQLALMYSIQQHLSHTMSQFIIATHSPMLMAYPGATIYEITDSSMQQVSLEDTEHYSITKSFLNHPEAYLRLLQ